MRQLFAPPIFEDEDKTRFARFLNNWLWVNLALITLNGIATLVFGPVERIWMSVALALSMVGALVILRRGLVQQASWLYLTCIWVMATLIVYNVEGVQAPMTSGFYALLISLAGILLGWRALLIFLGLSVAATAGMFSLAKVHWIAPPQSPIELTWVTMLVIWLATAFAIYSGTQSVRESLERAQQEIEERKRVEATLRENENRLRAIGDNLPGGMIYQLMVSPGGSRRFTYVSAGVNELHGCTPEQALADPGLLYGQVVAEDAGKLVSLESKAITEILTFDAEVRMRMKSGKVCWRRIISQPRLLENGVVLSDGVEIDITERKQSEEVLEQRVAERTAQLEAANKELEAFSYSVSHDLRAPLRAIDGFSRILFEDYASQLQPEALRYLDLVREAAQRMGKLIEDLLQFSRLSRQSLDKQPISLDLLVRDVLHELRAGESDRTMDIKIAEMPVCEADPALLRQVFVNLLSNALKFTRSCERAKIEIGSQVSNGRRVYYVRDNGVGFDMRYVGKLFGVFQRLHPADRYEGTGVGLAIVQRIIQRHDGRIWAEGCEGQGATFYFTLGCR